VRRIINWKDRKQIYFLRCDYGSALGTKQVNLTIPARQLISLLIFIMVIINTRNTTFSGLWQWRSRSNSIMLCKHTLQIIVQRKALTQQLLIPVQVTAQNSMLDQEDGNCGHSKMTVRDTKRDRKKLCIPQGTR
jgi:hypothetical protein